MGLRSVWYLIIAVATIAIGAMTYSPSRGIDPWWIVIGIGAAIAPVLTVKIVGFYLAMLLSTLGIGLLAAKTVVSMVGHHTFWALPAFMIGAYLGYKLFDMIWDEVRPRDEQPKEQKPNNGDASGASASGSNDAVGNAESIDDTVKRLTKQVLDEYNAKR